jgi:predicted Kef-type K+ transport protein
MPHHTPLITTIVGGLVLAFIFGSLAHRLRMPPLVGYLVAGIAVGPFTPGFVADVSLAQELASDKPVINMRDISSRNATKPAAHSHAPMMAKACV